MNRLNPPRPQSPTVQQPPSQVARLPAQQQPQSSNPQPQQPLTSSSSSSYVAIAAPSPPPGLHPRKGPMYRPAVLRHSSLVYANGDYPTTDKVGGEPRRDHWRRDSEVTECAASNCTKRFSFFERRHHCRRCGDIFCALHTSHTLPLDQNASPHPLGQLSKVCDTCYQFSANLNPSSGRTSRGSTGAGVNSRNHAPRVIEGGASEAEAEARERRDSGMGSSPVEMGARERKRREVGAASVPHDWSWSTF